MKGLRHIFWLPLVLLWAAFTGCSGECYENRNALPLAAFRISDSTAVYVDSLRVLGIGAPNDSTLWDGASRIDRLYLPFRVDADTTAYVFENMRDGVRDTVTFDYIRNPVLTSYECGVSYRFDIRSITTTGQFIDSVVCPLGFIDNTNKENLIIYLRHE